MRIDILTCLPELLESPFAHAIFQRATAKKFIEVHVHNLRDYALGKHKQIDDYMYGGGAGMVLMIEPIARCIESLKKIVDYQDIIYMTPDGEQLTQQLVNRFSLHDNLLILCGHYKGVDERVRTQLVTREISIGNYVLSGGELPAAVLTDAIIRLLPGVLSDETSALTDSFQDELLDAPVYTRPANFQGVQVPAVLLSGNEKNIQEWRYQQSLKKTAIRNPSI